MADPKRGYEFFINRAHRILKVRAWGMWDVPFTEKYDLELREKILEISENGIKSWSLLVDLNDYPPQIPEVQKIVVAGMKFGAVRGLKKEARLIGKTLTKLQLARLVKDAGMPSNSTFQSEKEAFHWLLTD